MSAFSTRLTLSSQVVFCIPSVIEMLWFTYCASEGSSTAKSFVSPALISNVYTYPPMFAVIVLSASDVAVKLNLYGVPVANASSS